MLKLESLLHRSTRTQSAKAQLAPGTNQRRNDPILNLGILRYTYVYIRFLHRDTINGTLKLSNQMPPH